MTFNKTFQDENKIVFEKESRTFSNVMKALGLIGVCMWILMNLFIGINILTTFFLAGVFIYILWVIYVDYIDDQAVPISHSFLFSPGVILIEMDNGATGSIPFSEIERFDLEIEHRSPIWANSTGVNYIHYHVNVIRKNGGIWTITSSTKENESKGVLMLLNQSVTLPSEPVEIKARLPGSVRVSGSIPMEVRWSSYQALSIHDSKLVFENRKRKIKREFLLTEYQRVAYSFSEAHFESISVIVFFFKPVGNESELEFKMRTKLQPVECLQLENWLHNQLSERKNVHT
jgi:hypothetical protein